MPRMANTAEAQLERILYILPAAARDGGVALEQLAHTLDTDAATVLRDVELATTRSFYHPGGSVESFTIGVDGDRVTVHAPIDFQRPVRLNAREALALSLGLRTLAAESTPERRDRILALAARLERGLVAPDADSMRGETRRTGVTDVELDTPEDELAVALGDDGFRGVVADAIEQRRACTLVYLKPGDAAPTPRLIAPHRLVYAEGRWYVAAHDLARDALRFFRLDRVLDATLEAEHTGAAPMPDIEEMLAAGAPFVAADDMHVDVRYSPRIARWIAERTAVEEADDGTVVVRHRVADPRWIVRHVLQYGGEAVVEEPPAARRWVNGAATRICGSRR
jgi:predicted DNA-binding transcriptional regulator YafY